MPLLRNLFEAFIYAVFPIVFLLLMLPSAARVALSYLKAVVWVQLWAPLYAVLHFATTLFSQAPAEAALLLPDGNTVLSLSNFTGLRQVMADTALIAGYLSLSIPMISYLVVNQGGAMIANLASRVGQSYEAPVSKGAEEATTGNIQLGTTSLGKADWWAQNTSPSWRAGVVTHQEPSTGATVTETGGGVYAVQRLASDVGVQIGARQVADYLQSHALRDAQSARLTAGSTYAEAMNSLFSQGPGFTRQSAAGDQYQSLLQSSEGRQFQETLQKLESVQESMRISDQFTREHRAEIALAASAGIGVPLLMRQLTASAGMRITDAQRTSIAEAYGQAREAALSVQLGDALAVTRAFTESDAFQNLARSGDEFARGFQATLQDAVRAEQQWQSAFSREKGLEEAHQRMQRWSESVDGDFTQGFVQHLRAHTLTGERWLEERLRAGDSTAIMRVAAAWAAGEDVADAIKPASLMTREDVRPRPGRRAAEEPSKAREREEPTDHLDHEKLSRLIPGYVRPDARRLMTCSECPRGAVTEWWAAVARHGGSGVRARVASRPGRPRGRRTVAPRLMIDMLLRAPRFAPGANLHREARCPKVCARCTKPRDRSSQKPFALSNHATPRDR